VVAFGRTRADLGRLDPDGGPPGDLRPSGLVVIAERLRPEARATVDYFRSQGVDLAVLSGDRPETVAAVAADAGLANGARPLDGGDLPADAHELRRRVLEHGVVGRIAPEGKRRVVEGLAAGGRYVAMVGDGVNDVPALKASRLAIAQGSGAQMARSVADLVLVRGEFSALPALVGEGRKLLRNLQRVAKLFIAKSAFAVFLILSVGLTPIAYPLLPRHLTLAASLTIGIPSFFLALAPSTGPFRSERFLYEVARFAFPAGTAAGLGVLASYLFALNVANMPLERARTVSTTVLVVVGLYLIVVLEASGRRRSAAVTTLCAALGALYGIVLAFPGTRHFFDLAPSAGVLVVAAVGAAIAIAGLVLTDDRFVPGGGRG
jgi:cation-transporting P-type ATPase E